MLLDDFLASNSKPQIDDVMHLKLKFPAEGYAHYIEQLEECDFGNHPGKSSRLNRARSGRLMAPSQVRNIGREITK